METTFLNIHTHKPQKDEEKTILNLDLETCCPNEGWFSFGIHPWSFDDEQFYSAKALKLLEKRLQNPNVVALGEAGLDRLHKASFDRQMEVFEKQIVLSERFSKPLIPTASSAALTRCGISSSGTPKLRIPKAISSSTTEETNWLSGF